MHDVCASHLLGVCVEGDGHVQQQLSVLHSADKVLNANFQVSGCLVDLLWVTLPSLSQLLRRLQQLVCVGVCVLQEKHTRRKTHQTLFIHTSKYIDFVTHLSISACCVYYGWITPQSKSLNAKWPTDSPFLTFIKHIICICCCSYVQILFTCTFELN